MAYEESTRKLKADPTETLLQVRKYPHLEIKERGIDESTAKLYGIRTKVSGEDGTTPLAYYFPYYDKEGKKVVGYKKRDLLKSKKDGFSSIGEVSVRSPLFGINTLGKDKFKLFITEGEYDAACLHRWIKRYQEHKKQDHRGIHVTSIGTGTKTADEFLLNNIEVLQQYREVILVFDNDKATPEEKYKGIVRGQDAVANVCLALEGMEVKYVKLALKDPCEMYKARRKTEMVQECLFNSLLYSPEDLVTVTDTKEEIDDLMTPLPRGVKIDFLPELSACLRGLRKNEFTVVLAPTKVGKSTVSRQVAFSLAQEEKVGMFFLEETLRDIKQQMIALYWGVRPAEFRSKPSILKRKQIIEARDWMKDRFLFYDVSKSMLLKPDSIVKMIKHCALMGYEHIMFDHLSFVLSGSEAKDERRLIDKLLHEVATSVRNYPIQMWMVAHISRNKNFRPKIDPETKEVEYPYWFPVRKEDGRGSGAFEQLCHNIICLEPQVLDEDGTKGDLRLVVRANRTWGEERVCDVLAYNPDNGRLE